jgi:hypothetical protein
MALGDPTLIPDAQVTADTLHYLKNKPSIPEALSVDPQMLKPYVYTPFPAAMYHVSGETRLVRSEAEKTKAQRDGFADSPDEAKAAQKRLNDAVALAAAERAYDDRKLSPKAQAELDAAEDSVEHHVLDPKVKRDGSGKIKVIEA